MADEIADEKNGAGLRRDVQGWISALQRETAKKRKRTEQRLMLPPATEDGALAIPEGMLRIAWVTDVVFGGNHHIPSPRELCLVGRPYAVFLIYERTIASFDFNEMTRLVVAAHEAAVRVQVGVGGFRELELSLHARDRHGGMSERHPELDGAIARLKEHRWYRCPFQVPAGAVCEG